MKPCKFVTLLLSSIVICSCFGKIQTELGLSRTDISFTSSTSEELVTSGLPIMLDNLEEDGIVCTDYQFDSNKTLVCIKGSWLTVERTSDSSIRISASDNIGHEPRFGVISVSNGDSRI